MAPRDNGVTWPQALDTFGVDWTPVAGWETRGYLPFDPVGCLVHHTASDDTRLSTIVDGVNQGGGVYVPGPLVHMFIEDTPDRVTWLVAGERRCNHAGTGDPAMLDRMAADLPVSPNPGPDQSNTGANTKLWGVELEGNGPEDFQPGTYVYDTAVKVYAAQCWWRGWNPYTRVAGHKEWTRRKVDPAFNMDTFRAAVAHTIEEVTQVSFLPLTPNSSRGDLSFLQNLVNVVHGTSMVTDGVWDDELQGILDKYVVDSPGDTNIGGNEFYRNVFRPFVQAYAGAQGPQGDPGPKGDKGAKGDPGPAGPPGPKPTSGTITGGTVQLS